jgi:hypothetical protein
MSVGDPSESSSRPILRVGDQTDGSVCEIESVCGCFLNRRKGAAPSRPANIKLATSGPKIPTSLDVLKKGF